MPRLRVEVGLAERDLLLAEAEAPRPEREGVLETIPHRPQNQEKDHDLARTASAPGASSEGRGIFDGRLW